MSEDSYQKNKRRKFIKHFSSDTEKNRIQTADEEYLEMAYSDVDDLPDTFYGNGQFSFNDWEDV